MLEAMIVDDALLDVATEAARVAGADDPVAVGMFCLAWWHRRKAREIRQGSVYADSAQAREQDIARAQELEKRADGLTAAYRQRMKEEKT